MLWAVTALARSCTEGKMTVRLCLAVHLAAAEPLLSDRGMEGYG